MHTRWSISNRIARGLVFALLLAGGGAAWAQEEDSASESARLFAMVFFTERLAADHPDKGFSGLWDDLDGEAVALAKAGIEFPGRPKILYEWGRSAAAAHEEDLAAEKFRAAAEIGPSPVRPKAVAALASLLKELAERPENKERALDLYEEARDWCRDEDVRDATGAAALTVKIVELKSAKGIDAYENKRFDDALQYFTAVKEEEGELAGRPAEMLDDLERNTGLFSLKALPVGIDGTSVLSAGRLRLVPNGTGERWEGKLAEGFRWRAGAYRAEVHVEGAEAPVTTADLRIGPGAAAVLVVPEKVPPGMVFVPAAPEDGVPRPFFIDRTEVTEAEWRKFFPDYKSSLPADESGRLPAHGISYEDAKEYARKVGKDLPTLEQWTWAAFAGTDRPFPWGDADPAKLANAGSGKPVRVGSYPDGAGPFGTLDMAGNVWEWLDSGFAIGAGFRSAFRMFREAKVDPLREPKPGPAAYERMDEAEKAKYYGSRAYKVDDTNIREVGLRCVLSL